MKINQYCCKICNILFLAIIHSYASFSQNYTKFYSGKLWQDNNHVFINAHGGGITFYSGKYYWFGEHKIKGEMGNKAYVGVHCYSSNDLYNWKDEGIALSVDSNEQSPIDTGCIIERPKVLYNAKTKKFVMWFHLELKGKGYTSALCGVAVSDRINGPYYFHHWERPDKQSLPVNYFGPNAIKDKFLLRDKDSGQMARDMNLFMDDDGKAYLIYSSEENSTLHISELSEDFLTTISHYVRVFPGGYNEAPAIFKHNKRYFLITSGTTGWAPNAARSAVADSLFGNWTKLGNPCIGPDSAFTFHSQSTYVLPVQNKTDAFIFMADRWNPKNAIDGRYVWLPIDFDNNNFHIGWKEDWNLHYFDNQNIDKDSGLRSLPDSSYKLSGKTLIRLSEKYLYKKTPERDLNLYVLRPKRSKKELPAIIYFFGGGWVTGNVEAQIADAAWFRDHGIIGITADYRIKSKDNTTPVESIKDAKSAVRFVRENAKKLGIDPNKIIVAGGSAGGHIAACTQISGGDESSENLSISSKPNALVLHNPVLGKGYGSAFFAMHPEFSPLLHIKHGWPPTILSCGTNDHTTPYKYAEEFTDSMKKAGNVCELITVENADHSCDWPVTNPNFLPTLTQMTAFLKKYHFIP